MVAVVGNKPLTAKGTILDPGERGVADLEFKVGSIPIDSTLMDALPADARAVVKQFHPAGSARGSARLRRWPLPPGGDPKGKVALDVFVDLNEGCSMKWDGLPYPVSNVTGHLEIRPDLWTFTDMRGENGPARLKAKGKVIGLLGKKLDVVVKIEAEHLSFDPQLRSALPPALADDLVDAQPRRVEPSRGEHPCGAGGRGPQAEGRPGRGGRGSSSN